ncbi:MAG: N-acyl homoserine lactonase family protein [Gemmatimonadales bacterium]
MREPLRVLSSVLCAAAWALSVGCGGQETGGASERGNEAAALPDAIRLYVLDCGTMTGDPARFRLQPEEISTTDMSVPCFLIAHPAGTLLWDTGAVPDQAWVPTGSPVAHHLVLPDASERDLTLRKPLLGQLAELGYAPADITYLALSHYHWDHVANANAFAASTWLVRREERDTMFADVPPVTVPENYARLEDSRTVIIDTDDYDVFGDGTVVIKSAPGHTPGHQALYLKLPRTGDVLLSGDIYHFAESRTLGRVPTFDVDPQQTVATREAIEAFLAETGAQLWIQHDAVGNALLKKSPLYYD